MARRGTGTGPWRCAAGCRSWTARETLLPLLKQKQTDLKSVATASLLALVDVGQRGPGRQRQ
ncbi:hypothetical protein [Streptomyces sp. S186]|uniref:hypothetical protein n=1 Tax=Streptomyces sp. S186 TaxID=3434395 RepID=UPI003F660E8B